MVYPLRVFIDHLLLLHVDRKRQPITIVYYGESHYIFRVIPPDTSTEALVPKTLGHHAVQAVF